MKGSDMSEDLTGLDFLLIVVALLIIVCTPAILWAVYGWAF